jgi:hypothetical protein
MFSQFGGRHPGLANCGLLGISRHAPAYLLLFPSNLLPCGRLQRKHSVVALCHYVFRPYLRCRLLVSPVFQVPAARCTLYFSRRHLVHHVFQLPEPRTPCIPGVGTTCTPYFRCWQLVHPVFEVPKARAPRTSVNCRHLKQSVVKDLYPFCIFSPNRQYGRERERKRERFSIGNQHGLLTIKK